MQSQQSSSTLPLRQQQLSWFADPVTIKQDQQLIDYIHHNHITQAIIHGDDFFSQWVNKVDHGPVDLVIWIQNQTFTFDQLVAQINHHIATDLNCNGTLYLAVNKFLCSAPLSCVNLPDNYNDAMLKYMSDSVDAEIYQYFLPDNTGSMFNWVHPLTRFYFKK